MMEKTMQTEIIISGFGGQGVLFAGQLLAYCALDNRKQVTWFPSYGPEMRGGTAHCTVIVSEEEIGSPVVKNPTAAIVMNLPSLDKYESFVKEGGLLVVNSSLVDRSPERTNIDILEMPANEIAEEIGDRRLVNLVLVGGLLQRLPIFSVEQVGASLDKHIPKRHRDMLTMNIAALKRGFKIAEGNKITA
jgi:2-oxoglutarate ferredoxin oxidoreductase subunit gamma